VAGANMTYSFREAWLQIKARFNRLLAYEQRS
jgi:hypothetical protein